MEVERVRAQLLAADRPASTEAIAEFVEGELRRESPTTTTSARHIRDLASGLRAQLIGAGPLERLLADTAVTDVVVNGAQDVWIDRGDGLRRVPLDLGNEEELRRLAQRLAARCGRRLDDAQPWVDARLPDGTRLHALLPPIATRGVCLAFRTFSQRCLTIADLHDRGTFTARSMELVLKILSARLAFLITGGTGSGKTTLLASLLTALPATERLIIVEDAAELRPSHPHVVGLQARMANADGAGAVSMRELIRQALRMRPDRIVIGECRGPEIVELLAALNTGHDGGAGTLHANSARDVLARLEALVAPVGMSQSALHSQLTSALHCVFHMRRGVEGRVLDEIAVLGRGEHGEMTALTAWSRRGGSTPGAETLDTLLALGRQT